MVNPGIHLIEISKKNMFILSCILTETSIIAKMSQNGLYSLVFLLIS